MLNKLYIILFATSLAFATPIKKYTHIQKTNNKIIINKSTKKNKIKKIVNKTYKVKPGDTIFSIAKKFQVSISDIYKVNHLTSKSTIYPGNILTIPTVTYVQKAEEAVKKNKLTVYKVKKGDTLISIAKKFHMKIEDLIKINHGLKKRSVLSINQEINVYAPKKVLKKRKKQTKYVVKKGDTVWSIAKRFHLTVNEFKLLNPKVKIRALREGDVVNISKDKAIKLAKLKQKRKKRLSGVLARFQKSHPVTSNYSDASANRVVRYAKRFLGTPYVWGASSGRAFDCSGFTQYVFKHAKGRLIPRISRRQAYYGMYVSRRNLRPADLVFFDTSRRRRGYVNHVGIFIGNQKFIHASSAKHRVVITSLNKPFYSQRFMWGRRIY